MNSAVTVGIVLALVGIIVYITRAWTNAENKKATHAEEAQMALERNQVLEREKLQAEYQRREEEDQEIQAYRHDSSSGTILFYPRVPEDKDPNDVN